MPSTRRQFLAQAAAVPLLAQKRTSPARPNILMITADDLAAWMLGCYGNTEIRTPNIDELARGGMRFINSFVCTPAASANQATLLTGRTPMQHGIQDFLTDRPIENPPQGQFEVPPSFQKEVMISDILAEQGYRCGFTGVWDMGSDQTPQHKFDFWYTMMRGSGYQNPHMSRNGQVVDETGYLPDLISAQATHFLDGQAGSQPFFLVASYPNPRAPYDGHPEKYRDMYAQTKFNASEWEPAAPNALRDKNYLQDVPGSLRKVAAATTALDDQIPKLFDKLSERKLRDNTLILLVGANGNLLGRHGLWGAGLASDPINMYDEAIQVPLIVNWPGNVPAEASRPQLVSSYDVLPMLCDAVDAPVPSRNLCGRSFLPVVTNRPFPKKDPWRNLVFGHYRNTDMARDNRFKLVLRDDGKGPNELFDVRGDPREKVNQYANPQFITVRDRLTAGIAGWKKRYSR